MTEKKDNTDAVKSKKPEDTFITLGLLIDYLDDYIGTTIKNNSTIPPGKLYKLLSKFNINDY